jgi:hypothetical protein
LKRSEGARAVARASSREKIDVTGAINFGYAIPALQFVFNGDGKSTTTATVSPAG